MKFPMIALALAWTVTPVSIQAQSAAPAQPPRVEQSRETESTPTSLRDKLLPDGAALRITAPSVAEDSPKVTPVITHVAVRRSAGTPLMIVGGALFVGGLLAGGDAGTLLIVAGAGIGAYGLYLHFQ